MTNLERLSMISLFFLFSFFPLGQGISKMKVETAKSNHTNHTINTLAILPFENNSITDYDLFTPLTKGLSAMLISDLMGHMDSIKLIEREKVQALIKEIAFSQTGITDDSTAIKVGKILGAQAITIGSFMVLGKQVRIDVRIIKVETGEVIAAESVLGKSSNFITLEQKIAKKISESLNAVFQTKKQSKKSDIKAALYYSKGIEAFDQGNHKKAKKLFKKCIKLDASYKVRTDRIFKLQK